MGNERSQLSGMEIDQKAVEVTDFYAHYTASLNSGNNVNLSIFVGEPLIGGTLWHNQTPLEKASKNLMLYRHPCILKYVSSWSKGSKFYLAVEDVKPLSHILSSLSGFQICIGLHSILKALCFLHDKALSSHNNVCTASIYVTKDGNWKLGGMEYLCRFSELNPEYLSKTRNSRYDKAVDPNENKLFQDEHGRKDVIDVYAFGVLAYEVLKRHSNEEIPSLAPFLHLCKNSLQNDDPNQRPKLSHLLETPFFNHDFINVYTFLLELPLKSDLEKEEFFASVLSQLQSFKEATVVSQLSGLLLSRLVVLNKTAQDKLLPWVLRPRRGDCGDALFSEESFRYFLVPKLLEIFCVRDAEIRQVLLNYFADFLDCFSKEELQSQILPELLVGIKDTNDQLVAATLRSLADLVPVLGASTVIGGKRAKLFSDGKPLRNYNKSLKQNGMMQEDNSRVSMPLEASVPNTNVDSISAMHDVMESLPERPRPDGEEVDTSTEEIEQSPEDDADNWEDWDISGNVIENTTTITSAAETVTTNNLHSVDMLGGQTAAELNVGDRSTNLLPDILELDIKNQKSNYFNQNEDFDYFRDMEPVIKSSIKVVAKDSDVDASVVAGINPNFRVANSEADNEDGWGDEEW